LISITIGNSVTSIGVAAFQASGLLTITIPDSVTTIGTNAFLGSNLATVYISNTEAALLGAAFSPIWTSPGSVSSPDFYGAPNTVTLTPPL
jgi:hypothetical protein